jgi:hypothetical protein
VLICVDTLLGVVTEGIFAEQPGTAGYTGPNVLGLGNANIILHNVDNSVPLGSYNRIPNPAVPYSGYIGILSNATIQTDNLSMQQVGETGNNAIFGSLDSLPLVAMNYQTSTPMSPTVQVVDTNGTRLSTDSIQRGSGFVHALMNTNSMTASIFGANPGAKNINNSVVGDQFGPSRCSYDTPAGGLATTTTISSTTTVVTVTAPNAFMVGEWVTLGLITNVSGTANFTSTLGLLLNGTEVQITGGDSATFYTFNFANAGFSSTSDIGTAWPHSSFRTCMIGGPSNLLTAMDWEADYWNGTQWVVNLGIPATGNALTGLLGTNIPSLSASNTFTASQNIDGAVVGNVYNLATWSHEIGNSTGAGCTTNCWTINGSPTVTLNSTDFIDPLGGNSMTKVAFSSAGNLQDVNGSSLSSGTSYAVSFEACYGTNTSTGVFTGTEIGTATGMGGNAGVNMVQCSNTTPVYTHYCSYATPTSSLTNTVQINWGTTPIGGTATIYLYGVSVAPSPLGGACPSAWTTTANPLTLNTPGVQASTFLGNVITPGSAQFTSGSGAPSGSCTSGSLYTNTGGTLTTTLYVCVSSAWNAVTIP